MLLAIDTSAGTSVAVVDRDRGVLAERSVEDTRRHAEVIGTLILECLEASSVAVETLSGIAVGMGPGPFTGLRVGIAAANAFAFGAGKPVVRVVSHDAVAYAHYVAAAASASGIVTGGGADATPLLVTTDARRHERYWSAYSGADEFALPIRVQGPGLQRPDELPEVVTGYDGYQRWDADWVSAASVGLLAESLYLHRRAFAGAEPLYLRSPDVTPSSGPRRVTA
ncbi:tRNA threonylcarbamoyl adenosine modification protein YeaZ [Cryobacterium mesophilum]|uniref:tRNA (Adenosine(37)-N6)-threonylcarbamoyltransferase complex dimerization subunit type 1 TsaB n=1 Tax=Terrimesophilobacter mesophilus TaxID=433647 RepID=A0A4R8VC77_9MICO|nr:tRNA (adenosine(37)-N6)-threonylcarbamoyltransferase complex dimerization subunit type 1 TsaB [Terrimesophilobacter mesophilus]MBB5632888.1 tRNA threonylcarbamoyl adenosine modification protein YeaZ [Terrimesophilobacter mesophilus]TFB79662.1 tRNA (adenosine(37)-N6)-threonylcarbamoyltransferase complex dimerization subunit type 1 TsaB [Terrimesophilobacter mesophilus]